MLCVATENHRRLCAFIQPTIEKKKMQCLYSSSAFHGQDKKVQEDVGGFEWVVHNAASFQRRSETFKEITKPSEKNTRGEGN